MHTPRVFTAASVHPLTLTEIKDHIRHAISGTVEDALLAIYRNAAVDYFQKRTNRTLHQTVYDLEMDCWPWSSDAIVLPLGAPLISVTHVKYKDEQGNQSTWAATDYIVDTDALPGRIAPAWDETYPTGTLYQLSPITIRYTAGIADGSPQVYPEDGIKYALLLLIGGMYENRESELVSSLKGIDVLAIRYGVESFIRRYQVEYVT